jgi:hypothetical protein
MKKLIIGLLVLTSCNEPGVQTVNNSRKAIPDQFEYNNHSYIEFSQYHATWGVHNPDCKCKNK